MSQVGLQRVANRASYATANRSRSARDSATFKYRQPPTLNGVHFNHLTFAGPLPQVYVGFFFSKQRLAQDEL
jgi:hypothetical protein